MHKAINAKFKKGDKVVSRMSGRRGYISEVYGEGWYAVHFDDDRIDLDNKMQEYQLRAANCSTVANAKFNVGDFVLVDQFGSGYKRGKVVALSGPNAKVEFVGGGTDTVPLHRLTASNCSTANSVVARAVANARAANSSAEPTVAKNGAADVLVSFTTITAKGLEKVQSRMTESDFDVWAKKVGAGDTQNVWAQLMQSGKAGFAITRPLSVTVTQL